MFNGMMDPSLIKLAQEHMSRMSPSDLARIQQQMMANPDLMKMASESMNNLSSEDLRNAAEQLKGTRPEEMSEISEKMANATPEDIAAMRSHVNAKINYELSAAQILKSKGNELHKQGRFKDASAKYLLAKKNAKGIPFSKGRTLLLACSLNLMSCYLKIGQYDECIKEGSEVIDYEPKNVKALYRRGQAYKELGRIEDAVSDLSKASEVSPDDETIADVLRDAKEWLIKKGGEKASRTLIIEEITEDMPALSLEDNVNSCTEYSVMQPRETNDCSTSQSEIDSGKPKINLEHFQTLKDDPETIRSFQNFMSNTDYDTLNALSAGGSGDIPPDMFKTASNMISKMSPEELQRMLQMASSFQDTDFENIKPGLVPPNMTPDMLKTATDMMSKMPQNLQKMYKIASTHKNGDRELFSIGAPVHSNGIKDTASKTPELQETSAPNLGETSSYNGLFSNDRNASSTPTFPISSVDLQQQMQNQMKDPAMRQMFTSMMTKMSPDMMANMSEQFGFKLSKEDAEKAQQAMSSLSPEALDRMMNWVNRIQRGADCAKKTKNWLLGKPGMILAICMLLLAVILHRLGFIGR